MEQNKTGKYLKYAIGEILLVMIGILLALQVNNWNSNVNNKKQEQFYLKKLIQNISQDTFYLNLRIDNIVKTQEEFVKIKNGFLTSNGKGFTNDSIALKLIGVYRFSPQTSTMDNLISTGKLGLISNQSLVDSLFTYYNDLNNFPSQRNTAVEKYTRETIGPRLLQMQGGILNLDKSAITKADSIFISNAIDLKMIIINRLQIDYIFSLDRAKRLVELIRTEIKE